MIDYSIRLDCTKPGTQETLYVRKGDTGTRAIQVTLFSGVAPLTLPAGCTAKFRAVKPDGSHLFNDCTITDIMKWCL